MPHEPEFKVLVAGYGSSTEEWDRASRAPASELPALSSEQKEVARKFGISEEEYARSYLALLYGRRRIEQRTADLGRIVQEVVRDLGPGYQLEWIRAEMGEERWVLRIVTPQAVVGAEIPRDLGDEALDSGEPRDKERLKRLLLSQVRPSALIGSRRHT